MTAQPYKWPNQRADAPASPIATQETPSAATPAAELERQIMSWSEPKNEREWWALHEIERLSEALSSAERRNEELVRDLAETTHQAEQHIAAKYQALARADAAESALASLRAGAEDVNRAMITGAAMAVSEVEDRNALKQENRTLRATIASLTGTVGEMREPWL